MAFTGITPQTLMAGIALLLVTSLPSTEGHGRLVEPPSRSSMWRYGFNTPRNYDDNALNCGGLNTEWYVNQGKCGVCGDPWDQAQPRDNEAGGKYGTGQITRTYSTGQVIDVRVEITANHKGWFEFRMCVHNDPSTPITHQCLDQHLLEHADGSGTRYPIDPYAQNVELKLKLPDGVTCSQCVLQWKWHGGNNYGSTQEEFYGCSDIAIGTSAATTPLATPLPTQPPVTTRQPTNPPFTLLPPVTTQKQTPFPTTAAGSGSGLDCHATGMFRGVPDLEKYCREQCPLGNCPPAYCACSSLPPTTPTVATTTTTTTPVPTTTTPTTTTTRTTTTQKVTPGQGTGSCHAIGQFVGVPELETYCKDQCPLGNCPTYYCACGSALPSTVRVTTAPPKTTTPLTTTKGNPPASTTKQPTQPPITTSLPSGSVLQCTAVGSWQGVPELNIFCTDHCRRGDCPKTCTCNSVSGAPSTTTTTTTTPRPTTTTPTTTTTTPTTTTTTTTPTTTTTTPTTTTPTTTTTTPTTTTPTTTGPNCEAIGLWKGDPTKDQWCNNNCPTLCPALSCHCAGMTTPTQPTTTPTTTTTTTTPLPTTTTTSAGGCRAVGPWLGDPLLDNWCKMTCTGYNGCDPQYCLCDGSTTTTAATTTSSASSGGSCHAINGWAGNPILDQFCMTECNTAGAVCPPEYCLCTRSGGAATTTPPATTTTTTTTPTTAAAASCYAINSWAGIPELDRQCDIGCKVGQCPVGYCACGPRLSSTTTTTTTTAQPASSGGCFAVGAGQGVPEMELWCRTQCAMGNCPPVYCAC